MALKCMSYKDTTRVGSDPTSRYVFHCPWADRFSNRNTLIRSIDANNTILKCESVEIAILQDDGFAGYAKLTADFAPAVRVDWTEADLPFKWRWEVAGEAITVSGAYHWSSDSEPLVNRHVLPVRQWPLAKIVLFGTRSNWNLSNMASYVDKPRVNNTTEFLGAAAETVYVHSSSATPRPYEDGTAVFDVQISLLWKPSGWNKFYREDTGAMDTLLLDGATGDAAKAYTPTDLSGLFE
jgi:hypothetical protein